MVSKVNYYDKIHDKIAAKLYKANKAVSDYHGQ